jgi:hypothetical protein
MNIEEARARWNGGKPSYDHDVESEMSCAMEYNSLGNQRKDIDYVRLTLEGENDGNSWHWICAGVDGGWLYINGACDYTGWD